MKRSRVPRATSNRGQSLPLRPGRWLLFAAVFLLSGGAWWFWPPGDRDQNAQLPIENRPATMPLPPLATSKFLNATSNATYVGAQRCAECHADEHATYLQTAHSRSMSEVDPGAQPPDGSFEHAASGRRYRVYRKDGQLRHRESIPLPGGDEIELCDYPLSHLVGSGRFARTYLVEDAGFLVESPVTWYESLQKWAMSPGYDAAHHRSFHRTIEHGCLFCHAGNCEPIEGNDQRLELVELAIGCERCHGPGSLHVARHAAGHTQPAPEGDRTIVNPSRLPRELAEAVCHQCHLTSEVQVAVRGRSPADYRPGLRWQDFAIDYGFGTAPQDMTVVGHVAQMRQSRCYLGSETLTCMTCHPGHAPPAPAERTEHYRAACQRCHAEPSCGVAEVDREVRNGNDCAACHMPQSPTDVPHVAFTHHRIGIHDPAAQRAMARGAGFRRLSPVLDISSLPEIDRRRALGLAYLQYDRDHEPAGPSHAYRDAARPLVESTIAAGLIDAPLALAQAELAGAGGDAAGAEQWAQRALTADHLTSQERAAALRLLAGLALQANQLDQAEPRLEELTALARDPRDWFLLGVCRQRQGKFPGAITAWERVRQIDPAQPETYDLLAEVYSLQGDDQRSQERRNQARSIRAAASNQ